MSDDGGTLFIIDPDTTANHGGIFASTVHCNGTLSAATPVTATFVARALVPLANGDQVVSARALDGAATGQTLHRVTIALYARLVRTAGFSDSGAIVYGSAGAHDGKYALFGDSNSPSTTGNRIAVFSTSTGVVAVAASHRRTTTRHSWSTAPARSCSS